MAIWKYINDNDGSIITTPDLADLAAVQAYATAQSHVIRGGTTKPGTTISRSPIEDSETISGENVTIDSTSLARLSATNAQELASELNSLSTVVSNLPTGGGIPNQFNRPITVFSQTVDIDDEATFNMYDDELALYSAASDNRLEFRLPTDSTVGANFPVEFLILHQGGTERFTSGPIFPPQGEPFGGPDNTIRIVAQGGEELRRNSETGTLLTFSEVHQNDLATITKEDANSPWVVRTVTLSSGALLLPDGIFNLSPNVTIRFTSSLQFFILSQTDISISAGDAFRVTAGDDDFAGFGVDENDVLVALVDNPSRLQTSDNEDWLIIRNAHNNAISLTELHFLNQVSETDTFTYERLEDRSDVTNVRVWISPFILDHAPFITPSTDSNNPQSGETEEYIGGDELDGADFDFRATSSQLTPITGESGSTVAPSALLYLDIDGSFNVASNISDIFVRIKDVDGTIISTHNLGDDFRGVVLSGSSDTYYVYDTVGAVDNYSGINYHAGQSIDVEYRITNRKFDVGSSVNVIPSIGDGEIPIEKLDPDTQALIRSNHTLSPEDQAKLDGLQTTSNPTPWPAGDLFVKDNDLSGDQAHYFNVGQQNGMLSGFEGARDVTFVVPNFVSVTQLQRTDDTSIKSPVTRIGVITLNSGNSNSPTEFTGQAFTASLPSSSFDINNPVGDAWQIDGTASNDLLTGADNSFQIHTGNLAQDVRDLIDNAGPDVQPFQLPENLQHLNRDTTITIDTTTGWHALSTPTAAKLTREYACCWTENRRSVTGNFFDDITQVQFTSFDSNNIFFYANPNDPFNTSFPGVQSYILNNNVRVSNDGGTNIEDVINKVGGFEYSLQIRLTEGVENSMLRLGTSSSTPLIGMNHEEGLYLNISRQDGGQHTRTYPQALHVIEGHLHDEIDEVESAETEIEIPQDLTGSLTITISVQLDNNGNDEGTHTETITITNLGSDQTIGSRTWSFTSYPDISATVRYEHDNNDLPYSRRVIFLPWDDPFTNAALTYNVGASHTVSETWNTGTTYAEYPINSGNPHDRFGIFDPELWNTERIRTPEKVVWQLVKWVDSDTSADPEMAARVIVDGELKGSESNDHKIRLYRPKSDFDTSIGNYGNNIVAVSKIQEYRYGSDFTVNDLRFASEHFDTFFGSFSNEQVETDTITFNANVGMKMLNISEIPTDPAGLNTGDVWNDSGTLTIVE